MTVLHSAYNLLFCRPQHYPEWEIAKEIIDNFDVRVLGEELSARTLCFIISKISFPFVFHQAYIRKAEEKLPEILGTDPDHEFHMDEVAVIESLLNEGRKLEEIKKMYQSKMSDF